MTITADQLLTGIVSGDLDVGIEPADALHPPAITIIVDGAEFARIGCLEIERPTAKITEDGKSVDVFPSPGMPDGFAIPVGVHEEAILIAEMLDSLFEKAYLALYDNEGQEPGESRCE